MSIGPVEPIGPDPQAIRENRTWFVGIGILLVVLGTVAIIAAFTATLATVLFFGLLLLFAAAAQILHALTAARWRGFVIHLLSAILYAAIGGLIVYDPVAGAIGLN